MKKIIGIIFISLMFANIGFAEIREIDFIKFNKNIYRTICVDGHKFVTWSASVGVSMVQAFEERDGKSLPVKC